MDKLISVIVPVYKVEKYLEKCVCSILNQTYTNIEIILVDDGSPDRCPEICDELAKSDNRILVIHKTNGGLSSARNAGLDVAKGEYISFIDSDDYINENMYHDMLQCLLNTGSDMCICNYDYVDENGCLWPIGVSSPIKDEVLNQEQLYQKLKEPANWYYITAWNKIYKREILCTDVFPVGKIHEDEFAIHHIMGKCNKAVCTAKSYYYYVQRSGSIMSERNMIARLDKNEALLDRYYYFNSIKHSDSVFFLHVAYGWITDIIKRNVTKDSIVINKRTKKITFEITKCLISKCDLRAIKLLLTYLYIRSSAYKVVRFVRRIVHWGSLFVKLTSKEHKIVLFQTPLHGNIGDQAITIAEFRLLSKKFPDVNIVEIPGGEIQSRLWNRLTMKMCVKKSDLVLVHGGGFLGTIWMNEEQQIQKIMSDLYDRKIIILPQTSYYDNDESGKRILKKDQVLYKNCKDLTVFLRERFSDDYIEAKFQGVKHLLVPDMVLWLDGYRLTETDRKKILLCLRNDKEKTQDVTPYVKQELSYLGESFQLTDTVVNHSISPDKREEEVRKKIEEFAKALLIVTDRLHGMVLAAIAQTPCVVILSKSHKVKGVYEWIKKLDYIELVEDVSQIKEAVQKVLSVENPHYDNTDIKKAFDPLISIIKEWEIK